MEEVQDERKAEAPGLPTDIEMENGRREGIYATCPVSVRHRNESHESDVQELLVLVQAGRRIRITIREHCFCVQVLDNV